MANKPGGKHSLPKTRFRIPKSILILWMRVKSIKNAICQYRRYLDQNHEMLERLDPSLVQNTEAVVTVNCQPKQLHTIFSAKPPVWNGNSTKVKNSPRIEEKGPSLEMLASPKNLQKLFPIYKPNKWPWNNSYKIFQRIGQPLHIPVKKTPVHQSRGC